MNDKGNHWPTPKEETAFGSGDLVIQPEMPPNEDASLSLDCVDTVALETIWDLCPASGKTFEESLIESGVISSRALAESYSKQYLLPFFDPPGNSPPPIDPSVRELLPSRICFDAMMAPLADDGTSIDVAIVSPETLKAREEVLRLTGRQMRPLFASLDVVESILAILYGEQGEDPHTIRDRQGVDIADRAGKPEAAPGDHDSSSTKFQEQAREYVIRLFEQALERRATDLYIDPIGERWRVRMRVAGSLVPVVAPDAHLLKAIERELKKLAGIDPQSNQQPQEGVIKLKHGRRLVMLKLLTGPSIAGETFVVKIRGRENAVRSLDQLGFSQQQLTRISETLEGPGGLILVAGPPAAGKRATLYACVQYLNRDNRLLCTVEEGIRAELSGVSQYPARPEYGMSYQDTVKTVLNREPDVLMLSDLRDAVTAEAAIRSASARKQTLVAINAWNAADGLFKLASLGVSSREIERATSLVIGQRMFRRQCSQCRVQRHYDMDALKTLGLSQHDQDWLDQYLVECGLDRIDGFISQGCQQCRGTGFRGGIVLFEEVISGSELVASLKLSGTAQRHRRGSRVALENIRQGNIRLEDVLLPAGDGKKLS